MFNKLAKLRGNSNTDVDYFLRFAIYIPISLEAEDNNFCIKN